MKTTVATSIKYGNYKHLQPVTELVLRWIKFYRNDLKEHFDFDDAIEFLVRPIRGTFQGWYRSKTNRIEIDPRYPPESVLDTIAHELVHAEQYKQGRLTWDHGACLWNGEVYKRGSTYKLYRNRPWEIEARERAAEFVKEMFLKEMRDKMQLGKEL
jgi:hypothetical protein